MRIDICGHDTNDLRRDERGVVVCGKCEDAAEQKAINARRQQRRCRHGTHWDVYCAYCG